MIKGESKIAKWRIRIITGLDAREERFKYYVLQRKSKSLFSLFDTYSDFGEYHCRLKDAEQRLRWAIDEESIPQPHSIKYKKIL